MKTREEIETELKALRERLEADDFEDAEADGLPDWSDTSNRITALEWVLGIGEEESL